MSKQDKKHSAVTAFFSHLKQERGAALATSLLVMSALAAVSMTVLAVVTHEARIAGSDLDRTQTYYAALAGIEKMTGGYSDLYVRTSKPTQAQFDAVAADYPSELVSEGYVFTRADGTPNQFIVKDPTGTTLNQTIQNGPFSGLIATVTPYILTSTARHVNTGASVTLQRTINNYLIPIFQFGMFSNEDMEVHPGPAFAFNGRVHANGNLYISGTTTFLNKVTTANEIVTDKLRNGQDHAEAMNIKVGTITVPLTQGSVTNGPNVSGAAPGGRGYFPGSPSGSFNTPWNTNSVAPAQTGVANQFGGQVLTRTTGGVPLLLPMQLEGNQTREIIKRILPSDASLPLLNASRYHTKSAIRILIDDEGTFGNDSAGIPAGGVNLSTFNPVTLPLGQALNGGINANGGGRALWRVNDNNTNVNNSYNEAAGTFPTQQVNGGAAIQADTVRGVKAPKAVKAITAMSKPSNGALITITSNAHGFVAGEKVFIANPNNATAPQANGGFTIGTVTANTFTLSGTGTAAFTLNPVYAGSGAVVYSYDAIPKSTNNVAIPPGAGLTGRILIQIVDANGNTRDVTTEILSMGMTEGEPNAIVQMQRPLWAAYTQGSRDSSGVPVNPAINTDLAYSNCLTDMLSKSHVAFDGEIKTSGGQPVQDGGLGYLTQLVDDDGATPQRLDMPSISPSCNNANPVACNLLTDWGTGNWSVYRDWNAIVPINVYNVREGRINTGLVATNVYERGITNVIELNMKNLARWVDGVYDNNLLGGSNAVSANINNPDGYTVYISDRRGDKVKAMTVNGQNFNATNGMVDNEDIYGPNGTLDPGEDVQNTGSLVKDVNELPDPAVLTSAPSYAGDIWKRSLAVNTWLNVDAGGINHKFLRNSVRLFNGENLRANGNRLGQTRGITIATENPVYIWGNYNTTGIDVAPPNGTSCLNDNTGVCSYTGNQVPTSIVCDAFFPISKTFFDSETALYPDNTNQRLADRNNAGGVTQETSARVAIIAGNNLSALAGAPDAGNAANESRLCGGMHNFPRFLENWSAAGNSVRWNFVGSLIPLYRSTQALGQYDAEGSIYNPPIRNWAFDITFTNPDRLPPGTPMFQHLEPTGFKQVL